ncbi:MAG TPA: hypothetical protein VLT32_00975 [Candidatus Sulfomarinibacteraceae bacterium]|nr:hypothetical protein [Candidatus Sulfomarinibacteraceae bacterium]
MIGERAITRPEVEGRPLPVVQVQLSELADDEGHEDRATKRVIAEIVLMSIEDPILNQHNCGTSRFLSQPELSGGLALTTAPARISDVESGYLTDARHWARF